MLKQIIKSSFVYTLLAFLPTASRIFLLPIFLIYLKPEDFAIIGLNTLIAGLLPLVMTMGIETAFVRYYFDYSKKPQLLRSYLSTILLFTICSSAFVGMLIIPFGDLLFEAIFKSDEFTFYPYGISAVISAFFAAIYNIIFSYYRNKQSIKQYALFSGGMFVATTAAETISIIVFRAGPAGVIWTKLCVTGIFTLFFLLRVLYKNGLFFEKRFLKPSYKYALPLVPYVLFGFIFTSFDRIMIENRLDLTSLAVYNLTMAIANITDSFMYALQLATYPLVYSMLKENIQKNIAQVNQVYRSIGVGVLLIICGLIACTPIGIINFLKPQYIPVIGLIPLVLITYSFRYLHIVYAESLFFFKNTGKLPWLTFIGGSVNILGNLVLLPPFGLAGAAFAFVLSKFVQLFPTYYWYLKTSELRFQLGYIYPLMIFTVLSSLLLFIGFETLLNHRVLLYSAYFVPLVFLLIYVYYFFWKDNNYRFAFPTIAKLKQHL